MRSDRAGTARGPLAAATLGPEFSRGVDALSDLGVAQGSQRCSTGVCSLAALSRSPSPGRFRVSTADRGQQWTTALAAAVTADRPPHGPIVVGFFAAFTVALLLHGAGALRAGMRRRGTVTVSLAVTRVAAWIAWIVGGSAVGVTGVALPEMAGALALGADGRDRSRMETLRPLPSRDLPWH